MESSTIDDFLQGTFPMTATTLFGLEDTLAQELEKIGATEVTILVSLSSYLQPLEQKVKSLFSLKIQSINQTAFAIVNIFIYICRKFEIHNHHFASKEKQETNV